MRSPSTTTTTLPSPFSSPGTRKCACSSGRGATTLQAPSHALPPLPERLRPSPQVAKAAAARTSGRPKKTRSMRPNSSSSSSRSSSEQPRPAPRLGSETEQQRPPRLHLHPHLHVRQAPMVHPSTRRRLPSPKQRSSTSTRRSRRERTLSPPLACCFRRDQLLVPPQRGRKTGDSQGIAKYGL